MHRYVWSTCINYILFLFLLLLGFSACGGSEDTVGLFLQTFSDPVKAASHPGRIVMLFYFAKKQTV